MRSGELRPVIRRYGALWIDWDERDYCAWFAEAKGWLPTDTIRQPVGVLDRLVDDAVQRHQEREREAERRKNSRKF